MGVVDTRKTHILLLIFYFLTLIIKHLFVQQMQPTIHTPTNNQSLFQILLTIHSSEGILLRVSLPISSDCLDIQQISEVEVNPLYHEFIRKIALFFKTVDLILPIVF